MRCGHSLFSCRQNNSIPDTKRVFCVAASCRDLASCFLLPLKIDTTHQELYTPRRQPNITGRVDRENLPRCNGTDRALVVFLRMRFECSIYGRPACYSECAFRMNFMVVVSLRAKLAAGVMKTRNVCEPQTTSLAPFDGKPSLLCVSTTFGPCETYIYNRCRTCVSPVRHREGRRSRSDSPRSGTSSTLATCENIAPT